MNKLGRHIVAEFYGCNAQILNDVTHIEESMVRAAQESHATIINTTFHHFSPYGVSGVVVIQESHLAIHTWPEYQYAALDLFTCGEEVDPWVCYKYLLNRLQARHGSAIELGRGEKELLEKIPLAHPQNLKPSLKYNEIARNIWFTERDETIALSLRHTGEVLYRRQSPYQKVEIYDTLAYGKMLTLDGKVMTTEKDEYVYHEMITHVPLFTHPAPKKVLVIGGGDGGCVREVLKHSEIEKVVMVEIDELVIEASRIHLPHLASAFDNPKLELRIEDGIKYVANTLHPNFDIVIVDSTDPIGPAEGLFTIDFYKNVYRILNEDGILVVQSESPRYNVEVFQEIYQCFDNIFGKERVFCYLINVPTYPSGTWSIAYCSKGRAHPLHTFSHERYQAFLQNHQLQYYNKSIHKAAFMLPNFVSHLLKKPTLEW
ncbi:MAG: polyamine aminopropyltransferase [Bacteroidia bacterium]|nr:polyamine aminopropyltransferase [Bacteroidia bacterium]MDW8157694.1 polyamine aminopropyltransferase [Bacteroidia bacterium]